MKARRVAVVVSIAVLGLLPSDALAHGEHDHAVEDSVPLDHVAKDPRRETITNRATARDAAASAAAVTGTEGDVGQWGPVIDWPVVGVHVALLPNGKVLAYDSVGRDSFEASLASLALTITMNRIAASPPGRRGAACRSC